MNTGLNMSDITFDIRWHYPPEHTCLALSKARPMKNVGEVIYKRNRARGVITAETHVNS
jgi:hypothetical protein